MGRKAKGFSGIVGYNPDSGKTAISYNGVRFYTKDASVIKLAQKGDFEQAARRWAGKTSTARAIRQANKTAAKPIYENPQRALFKKMFTAEKKERIGTSAKERLEFAREYLQTSSEVDKYVTNAVVKKMDSISKNMDRLPNDLQQRINDKVLEQVEKLYKEKGEVKDSDIDNIFASVKDELKDYMLENSDDEELNATINEIADMPMSEIMNLNRY